MERFLQTHLVWLAWSPVTQRSHFMKTSVLATALLQLFIHSPSPRPHRGHREESDWVTSSSVLQRRAENERLLSSTDDLSGCKWISSLGISIIHIYTHTYLNKNCSTSICLDMFGFASLDLAYRLRLQWGTMPSATGCTLFNGLTILHYSLSWFPHAEANPVS